MPPTRSRSRSATRSRRRSCGPRRGRGNVRSAAYAGPVIARLRGKPVASTPEGLVLDVGGVGYLVAATPSVIRQCRCEDGADATAEIVVETSLHVRVVAMQLYDFAERGEREL